jgi:hypothetical protein
VVAVLTAHREVGDHTAREDRRMGGTTLLVTVRVALFPARHIPRAQ